MDGERQTPARILVVDDNVEIQTIFRKILEEEDGTAHAGLASAKTQLFGSTTSASPTGRTLAVDTASQGQEAMELVEKSLQEGKPYSMAFVDMRMPPGWDGLETIRNLWKCDSRLQVVLCTAYSDHSLDHIARELNPGDRLLILKKPFEATEAVQAAKSLVEKWQLGRQAELKMEQLDQLVQERTAKIQHMALHDELTGLPNRALLMVRIAACFERRNRHPDHKFAIMFLDCDRFKTINDSLGHEVGDLLLVSIAERLRESLRAGDMVSYGDSMPVRLGGDEFVVLLDDIREDTDAARVAERILEVLHAPYKIAGQVFHITVSVGITTSQRPYDSPSDMVRDADTAMYRAKGSGRSRYVMFDERMHEQAAARLALEVELRNALVEQQFVVHYQPIVRAPGGLVGFEALIRWQHPQRGLISPSGFIGVAEEMGLILQIDFWVIREACRQLKVWQDRYPEMELTLNANLSRRSLADPTLARQVVQMVAESGVLANSLCLEITESAVMDDTLLAAQLIEDIKRAGIRLYLDDFGTGQSSLSCLHQFALSGLKIDCSFVRDMTSREELQSVLKAIVELARAFHMEVIVEGVETPEQAAILDGLKCNKLQGYLFSKPMGAKDAEDYIRSYMAGSPREACLAAGHDRA
ncbi:MAG: EAL domain-containing protein [Phycisphaerae bacterium]|jgi:diguanylate cyclase (GGDEF)-like protein